jgi:hypothetical protein
MNALLRPGFDVDIDALPSWSLLRRRTLSVAGLHSEYARSILAGELLCKIGAEVKLSCDADYWLECVISDPKAALRKHSICSSAWKAVPFRLHKKPDERLAFARILDAAFWKRDEYQDSHRRAVIRALLSWRLSQHVWGISEKIRLAKSDANGCYAEHFTEDAVVRKFALLTEFVALSQDVFTTEGAFDWSTTSASRERDASGEEPESALYDFARSVRLLLKQLHDEESIRRNVYMDTSSSSRLIEIADEIFAPVPSTTSS